MLSHKIQLSRTPCRVIRNRYFEVLINFFALTFREKDTVDFGTLQRISQEIMKKKIFGTSDTWSTSHLSQQPTKPAYYIEDCWIFECSVQ